MNPVEYFRLRHWRKKVQKLTRQLADRRHVDSDILPEESSRALLALELRGAAVARAADIAEMRLFIQMLPRELAHVLPRESFAWLRGWLDLIAVVGMVACGVRGLFFQPYQIPTSSMQPTLYGIHYIADDAKLNPWIGKLPQPLDWLLFSTRRAELTTRAPGRVNQLSAFTEYYLWEYSKVEIGQDSYVLPGAPQKVAEYAKLYPNYRYPGADTLCDGYLASGDHLFVDRVSFHLTGLNRGDVVVFTTEGIMDSRNQPLAKTSGYFYIKRLVGMPGDTLRIINGVLQVKPASTETFRPITEFSDVFKKLYSGLGGYQGHSIYLGNRETGNYLSTEGEEFTVPPDSFFMLGDNVNFSSDSRVWGVVPRSNIVGRAWLVFWPFSRRWGQIDSKEAAAVPTGVPGRNTFDSMNIQ